MFTPKVESNGNQMDIEKEAGLMHGVLKGSCRAVAYIVATTLFMV